VTSYLGTSNSSEETLNRSRSLAQAIGAQHFNIDIEEATKAIENIFVKTTGKTPKYVAHGGTYTEDLALQNI
jgi:NAD+ synthase (glutamine-hydrolysing)